MSLSDRLRAARKNAGYASAADAARRLGMPYGTYSGHENGQRGVKDDDIIKYARTFGVSRTWLAYGEEIKPYNHELLEILGVSGKLADGEIEWHDDPITSKAMFVPGIFNVPLAALYIDGDGLRPYAYQGSLLLFSSQYTSDIESVFKYTCVCITDNQKAYIQRPVLSNSKDSHHLKALMFERVLDVKIVKVSPILAVITPFGYGVLLERSDDVIDSFFEHPDAAPTKT